MIKREEVKKFTPAAASELAKLARLEMSGEELELIGKDLSAILDYVSELKQVGAITNDTEPALGFDLGFPGADRPKSGPMVGVVNVWREDVPTPSPATREELLASAPEREGDYFKVKKILG